MSPRIFITGVSGYIGGHIVGVLSKKHPEYQLVTLVRNEDQAKTINKTWPGVVTVIGDSDDHKLLVREGAQTDVVLRKLISLFLCCTGPGRQLRAVLPNNSNLDQSSPQLIIYLPETL
jgi:nucleoside-diphosphate-sugar epimerase